MCFPKKHHSIVLFAATANHFSQKKISYTEMEDLFCFLSRNVTDCIISCSLMDGLQCTNGSTVCGPESSKVQRCHFSNCFPALLLLKIHCNWSTSRVYRVNFNVLQLAEQGHDWYHAYSISQHILLSVRSICIGKQYLH